MFEIWLAPITTSQPTQIALTAAAVLTLADVVFGVANAIMAGEFSSAKMREGIKHKSASFLLVLVGLVSDVMISAGLEVGIQSPALLTVSVYLTIMEIGSLMETALKMNPDLAATMAFKFLKGGSDD